jgi:hypothetical protein
MHQARGIVSHFWWRHLSPEDGNDLTSDVHKHSSPWTLWQALSTTLKCLHDVKTFAYFSGFVYPWPLPYFYCSLFSFPLLYNLDSNQFLSSFTHNPSLDWLKVYALKYYCTSSSVRCARSRLESTGETRTIFRVAKITIAIVLSLKKKYVLSASCLII